MYAQLVFHRFPLIEGDVKPGLTGGGKNSPLLGEKTKCRQQQLCSFRQWSKQTKTISGPTTRTSNHTQTNCGNA